MKIYEIGLKQAIDMLLAKVISAVEIVSGLLERIDNTEQKIHALNYIDAQLAIDEARLADSRRAKGTQKSEYDGVPVMVKDNICVKDMPMTCSSKMLYNFVPQYDAFVIERFKALGINAFAKTNLDEFAMGISTQTSAFGATFNPWNLDCVPGGSSGGSAAAVSAGMAPFALGTDTGGSIRQPASFCGVVGLKPTYGVVSRYGAVAVASSLEQIGAITRSVEDAALALNAICGHDIKDSTSVDNKVPDYSKNIKGGIKGIKIGLPKEFIEYDKLDSQIKAALCECATMFEQMGAIVEITSMPTFEYALPVYSVISSAEAASNLSRFDGVRYGYRTKEYDGLYDLYAKTRSEGFGAEVKRRIMLGNYVLSANHYEDYYLKSLKVRNLIRRDYNSLLEKYDFLISPTTPFAAFEVSENSSVLSSDVYTQIANLVGAPAITLPCGLTENKLPAGVQILAKAFDEPNLLRAAWCLEQALPPIGKPLFAGGTK